MHISPRNSICIKGFAITCIVLHHFYTTGCLQGREIISHILGNLGSCNVVLFLFLAGYGAYISYVTSAETGRKSYFLKRFIKIYIPYLVVSAIWAVYSLRNICTAEMTLPILMSFFGIVVTNNGLIDFTMWYMTFMFFWYVIFGFIMYFKINNKIKITILFAIACFLHIYWSEDMPDFSMLMRMSAFGFPCGVLFAYISLNWNKFMKAVQNRIFQVVVGISCFSLFIYIYMLWDFSADIYVISSLLYSVGIILIFNIIESVYKCRVLYFLGGVSYMVYLIHMKVIYLAGEYLTGRWTLMTVGAVFAIIVLAGWGMNCLTKKIIQ